MLGGVLGKSPFGLAGMAANAVNGDKGSSFLDGLGLVGQAVQGATGQGGSFADGFGLVGQAIGGAPRMAGSAMQPFASGGMVNMPVGGIEFGMPEGKDGNIMGDVTGLLGKAGDLFGSRSAGEGGADRNELLMSLLSTFGNMS